MPRLVLLNLVNGSGSGSPGSQSLSAGRASFHAMLSAHASCTLAGMSCAHAAHRPAERQRRRGSRRVSMLSVRSPPTLCCTGPRCKSATREGLGGAVMRCHGIRHGCGQRVCRACEATCALPADLLGSASSMRKPPSAVWSHGASRRLRRAPARTARRQEQSIGSGPPARLTAVRLLLLLLREAEGKATAGSGLTACPQRQSAAATAPPCAAPCSCSARCRFSPLPRPPSG